MMNPSAALLFVRALLDPQFAEFPDPKPVVPAVVEPPTDPLHDAARIKAAADKRARKMAKRLKEATK
jgi:hypothetical protein